MKWSYSHTYKVEEKIFVKGSRISISKAKCRSFLKILSLIVNQARLQIKDGVDDFFSSEKHCPDNLGSIQALSQSLRIVQISP